MRNITSKKIKENNQLAMSALHSASSNRTQNCKLHPIQLDSIRHGSLKFESDTWFTSPEAAMFLGISVQALLNKVSGGKVPFYKFGRRNRYKKSELEELLSQNRKGPMYGYKKGN